MTEEFVRPWLWKVPKDGVIGKHVRMKDGYEKVSGKGTFTRDVSLNGMLYAKFICSPYAHAKIKSVDTTEARAFPGVRDILTYDDLDLAWFKTHAMSGYFPFSDTDTYKINKIGVDKYGPVQDVLTKPDVANWPGQPLGIIVVAESELTCDQALKLIKIEWEPLPVIMDPEEALKPGAPVLFPEMSSDGNLRKEMVHTWGDVEEGFKEADRVVEFKVFHDEINWGGTEGGVSVAEWKGDNLEVWHHCQDPESEGQNMLARYTTENKINLHVLHQGGIFGSTTHLAVGATMDMMATLAARRTGRPVKALYDGSHFHGLEEACGYYLYKIGFKNTGKITAVDIHYIGVCLLGVGFKLHDATNIPNIRCTDSSVFVNRGGNGPMRAGAMECEVVTSVFEHVAGELGMDPTKVAMINDGCQGKDMAWVNENVKKPQGFDATRDSLKEVLEAGKKAIDWDNKWHLPGARKLPNGKYHGIGMVWFEAWRVTSQFRFIKKIGLVMRRDGTVLMINRRSETGTHGTSTYPQIVSDESGIRYEDIQNRHHHDAGFDLGVVGNSSGMLWNSPGLVRVARKLKQQILEFAVVPRPLFLGGNAPAFFPGKKVEELDIKDSIIFEKANPSNKKTVAELAALCSTEIFAWDTGYHNAEKPKLHMTRQAYFIEVEVDPGTGETEIKKVVVSRDCGRVINPDSCDQQLYGVYQGVSRSNTETIYHDPRTGVKLNDNLIDYAQFTMNDIGSVDIHKLETGLGYGPYGLVGIGESSACCTNAITGPAIFNAIGKYIDSYPTTPDKVLKALGKA
jgi:CO/xanthine dehydrogenase Mo-binding subunit